MKTYKTEAKILKAKKEMMIIINVRSVILFETVAGYQRIKYCR